MDKIINGRTLVPLSFIVVLTGGIVWLSQVYSTTAANAKTIEEVKTLNKEYFDILRRIDRRLSKMEGYLYKYKTKGD